MPRDELNDLRLLAHEAAIRIARLREKAASYDAITVFEYRADGLLIERLKRASGLEAARP